MQVRRVLTLLAIALAALFVLSACGGGEEPAPTPEPTVAEAAAEARPQQDRDGRRGTARRAAADAADTAGDEREDGEDAEETATATAVAGTTAAQPCQRPPRDRDRCRPRRSAGDPFARWRPHCLDHTRRSRTQSHRTALPLHLCRRQQDLPRCARRVRELSLSARLGPG